MHAGIEVIRFVATAEGSYGKDDEHGREESMLNSSNANDAREMEAVPWCVSLTLLMHRAQGEKRGVYTHTASHTRRAVAIFVQVASAGLELECRCHGEEAEEEMQQAQMQE